MRPEAVHLTPRSSGRELRYVSLRSTSLRSAAQLKVR